VEKKGGWWDYYYVRYFVGSIAGAIFLLGAIKTNSVLDAQFSDWFRVLAGTSDTAKSSGEHADLPTLGALAGLGTVGLAFCYLASAPVLLMHALRERFGSGIQSYNWVRRIIVWTTLLVGVLALIAGVVSSMRDTNTGLIAGSPWLTSAIAWLGRAAPYVPYTLLVATQLFFLWPKKPDQIRDGYVVLAKERAEASKKDVGGKEGVTAASEYIESYRHLREHGNALLIIVLEAVLAAALAAAPSVGCFGLLVVAWILPATFAWFLGTYLEKNLAGI